MQQRPALEANAPRASTPQDGGSRIVLPAMPHGAATWEKASPPELGMSVCKGIEWLAAAKTSRTPKHQRMASASERKRGEDIFVNFLQSEVVGRRYHWNARPRLVGRFFPTRGRLEKSSESGARGGGGRGIGPVQCTDKKNEREQQRTRLWRRSHPR